MTMTETDLSRPAKRSRFSKESWALMVLLALFVVGVFGLITATGWEDTRAQLAKLSVWQIGVLLVLSLVNYVFRGLRWHVFARRLGLGLGVFANLRHFIGGFAMSVTPGRVGELVRMRWIRRETGWAFERSAPLVLVDRSFDLATMALILCAGFAMTSGANGVLPVALLALGVALAATRPKLLAALVTLAYRATGFKPRLFGRIRQAARSLRHFSNPWVITAGLALGLVGWLAEGVAFYLLLMWLGAEIGLVTAIAIFVFATLAGGLTGAPGGLGGAEAAMIALLKMQGIPLDVSIPATAVIRVTTLWFAIGLGLAVFPLAERISLIPERRAE